CVCVCVCVCARNDVKVCVFFFLWGCVLWWGGCSFTAKPGRQLVDCLFQRPSFGWVPVRVPPPLPKFLWPCSDANGTRLMESEAHGLIPPDVGFCAVFGRIFSLGLGH